MQNPAATAVAAGFCMEAVLAPPGKRCGGGPGGAAGRSPAAQRPARTSTIRSGWREEVSQ